MNLSQSKKLNARLKEIKNSFSKNQYKKFLNIYKGAVESQEEFRDECEFYEMEMIEFALEIFWDEIELSIK